MKRTLKKYSQSFRDQVLEDYFKSDLNRSAFCRKWDINRVTFEGWLNTCKNEKNCVSLQPNSKTMDAKTKAIDDLRAENERLRREVEYYKLRSTGYERLLEIVKEEDGIDLLKKDGAKQ